MPTVTLPLVGTVERKYLIYGGAAVAGIVAVAWYRRRNTSATAGAAQGMIDPNATDPLTGMTYGAELGSGGGSYVNPNPIPADTTTPTWTAPATNPEWAQQAISALGNVGIDPTTASTAIGAYLAGQPLTVDQASLIRQAWAQIGKPPAGPNSFSLAPVTGGNPPTTGTPDPTPAPTPAPTPTPAPEPSPAPKPKPPTLSAPTGLHTVASDTMSFTAQWTPVPGATRYKVTTSLGQSWETASARHIIPVDAAHRGQRVIVQVSAGTTPDNYGPYAQYWSRTK